MESMIVPELTTLFEQHLAELVARREPGLRVKGSTLRFHQEWLAGLSDEARNLWEAFLHEGRHECKECEDTGRFPARASTQIPCPHCERGQSLRESTIKTLNERSGIPATIYGGFRSMRQWLGLSEHLSLEKERAIVVAETLAYSRFKPVAECDIPVLESTNDLPKNWLMLSGPPGTGKTALACTLGNMMIDRAMWRVKFVNVTRFVDMLREANGAEWKGPSAYSMMQDMYSADLVILDEINVRHVTGFVLDSLYKILDARYSNGLPLIMTANVRVQKRDGKIRSKDLEDIWGTATVDRIYHRGFWEEMDGISLRHGGV